MDNINNIESKMEIVQFENSNDLLIFIYIPKGYIATEFKLEGHSVYKIGKLNIVNSLKMFKKLRDKNKDVRLFLHKKLLNINWDFKKFPNPTIYGALPLTVKNEENA